MNTTTLIHNTVMNNKPLQMTLYGLVACFSVAIFLKNAWVAEDAFILLRSVDQFLHGNGFRWNMHERAQVYTSPLWFLLVIASTAVCKTLYLNLIGLSLGLHVALLLVMALLIRNIWRWSAAVLLLTLSQAFFDFTASGLEYPLVYLLLGSFVLLYLRGQHVQDRFWLAVCAGLALITRHDTLPLILPAVIHLLWEYRKSLSLRQQVEVLCLLSIPITCWTLFSLLYYGVPLPNTAYAKLSIPGLPQADRFNRGYIYATVTGTNDPITLVCIAAATLRGLLSRSITRLCIAIGLLLAFTYITSIGADYMMGRFYAPLYIVAVLQMTTFIWQRPFVNRIEVCLMGLGTSFFFFMLCVYNIGGIQALINAKYLTEENATSFIYVICAIPALALSMGSFFSTRWRTLTTSVFLLLLFYSTQPGGDSPWHTDYKDWGKTDDFDLWWMQNTVSRERYWIYRDTSLYAWFHRDPNQVFPDHEWCRNSLSAPKVSILWVSGMAGYCLAIDKIGEDYNGLVSPLMARMPKRPDTVWASGGATRIVPAGYIASLESGQNLIEDPDLARYYDKLRILTEAEPLLTAERIRTIIAFNLGAYDSWLHAYTERVLKTLPPSPSAD